MSAKQKDPLAWYVPPMVMFQLAVPVVGMLAFLLFPALQAAEHGSPVPAAALALIVVGVVFLFLARLQFYRQTRFFMFEPQQLTGIRRRLRFTAYACLGIGVLMLLALAACFDP
ncbi:MAG: hypothetical protein RLZZ265_3336 [Verrucomicrobiota bacterium]